MRRLAVLSVAATVLAALAATSCGVLADENAAVAGGVGIPASTVDAMTRDRAFAQLLGYEVATGKSVLPGSSARTALEFAVQTQTLENFARRWGVEPREDVAGLDKQLSSAGASSAKLSPEARKVAARYVGTLDALGSRFSKMSKPTEADLRRLYDSAPSRWHQVCVSAVAVPSAKVSATRRALERGVRLGDLPKKVKGVRLAADLKQGCLTINEVPSVLGREIDRAPVGRLRGPVEITVQDEPISVWFRVESRKVISFRSARSELSTLASQMVQQGPFAWLPLVMSDTVTVNPRYGSGIEISQGRNGAQASIAAPVTPASPGSATATTVPAGSGSTTQSGAGGAQSGAGGAQTGAGGAQTGTAGP